MLNFGIRTGGGFGEALGSYPLYDTQRYDFVNRSIFDFVFFVIMQALFLNIVFGLVIDSFAKLREEEKFNEYDKNNVCYISGLEKYIFRKEGVDFNNHTRHQQNKWHYIYYILKLLRKDEDEYNGFESYVFHKYRDGDISWFPVGLADSLIKCAEAKEQLKLESERQQGKAGSTEEKLDLLLQKLDSLAGEQKK